MPLSQRDRLIILLGNYCRRGEMPPAGLLEDVTLFAYQAQGRESVRCEQLAREAGQTALADRMRDTFPDQLT